MLARAKKPGLSEPSWFSSSASTSKARDWASTDGLMREILPAKLRSG